MPAVTAFCTSSKPARPLTTRQAAAGSSPASTRAPITLSTALCRPTSSRTTLQHAVGGREGRRVHAAGAVEEPLAGAKALGEPLDDLGGGDLAGPPGPVHDVEHLGHAVLAADAAGRRPGAARLVPVDRADVGARCHRDGDDVELLLREQVGVGAVGHLPDLPERTQ